MTVEPHRNAGVHAMGWAVQRQRRVWSLMALLVLAAPARGEGPADDDGALVPQSVALDDRQDEAGPLNDAGLAARVVPHGRPVLPILGMAGAGALVLALGFVLGAHRRARLTRRGRASGHLLVEHRTALPPPGRAGLMALGREATRRGRLDDAADWFDAATRLYPSAVETHVELARALLRLGRADEAAEAFAEACHVAPTRAELRMERARALVAAGRTREAMDQIARAVADEAELAADAAGDAAFAALKDHPLFLAAVGRV